MNYPKLIAVLCMSLLAGCDEERSDTCTTSSDCAESQECIGIDSETGEGVCVSRELDPCVDADCAPDEVCQPDGICEAAWTYPEDWRYVAIISTTRNPTDLDDTNTPGPDIDAIELMANGESIYATTVEAFGQGAGGNDDGNVNAVVSSLLGSRDAIPTGGGECDLSEGTGFWSMGDSTGFVVVSFDNTSLEDGNTISVWELNDLICDNISTTRADIFQLFTGSSEVDLTAISSASDISGNNWLSQGVGIGGPLLEYTVDFPSFGVARAVSPTR